MPITKDEVIASYKKRQLRRVQFIPYNRPPSAVRGICRPPQANEAGGSGWFSKLVDPVARVIVGTFSSLFSSVFGKGLASTTGEIITTIEKVPKVRLSPELREHGENPANVRLSRHYDGTDRSEQELISRNDSIFELEQLLKQKRAEIDHLTELLHSRMIESSILPSTDYKNKRKINENSSIISSSSQQAVNHEKMKKGKANPSKLECQIEQRVNLNENATSGAHANIFEEGFDSPIDIARAYMGLKPRKAALSSLGLQNQTCHRDEVSPLNFRFGNKPSNAAIASSSAVCFRVIPRDAGNDIMTQKPQSRSALYKLLRSPYDRSFMWTNPKKCSPYKSNNVEPTRTSKWTMPPSNIRHFGNRQKCSPYKSNNVEPTMKSKWTTPPSNIRHFGNRQALKRGISYMDAGYYDNNARRVRQKSCLMDLNLKTHVDQEHGQDIELKGLNDGLFAPPPQSVEMAKKILHELDKKKNDSTKLTNV